MEETIKSLIEKFEKIKNKGWIKSVQRGNGGIGRTLEEELGIENNQFELPDYFDIELKVKKKDGIHKNITLFSISPITNDTESTISKIQRKYGYRDPNNPEYKRLQKWFEYKTIKPTDDYHFFKLDMNEKYIYINVLNKDFKIIDTILGWEISEIEKKLERKLQNLALIEAERLWKNNQVYYKYTNMKIYKLKNIETFFELFKKRKIRIAFKIGVYKTGEKKGKACDHGTSFEIHKNNIEKLYDRIYSVE